MAFKTNDKTERVTVRLNKNQLEFLDRLSVEYNCSLSDILRMFVNMYMYKGDNK